MEVTNPVLLMALSTASAALTMVWLGYRSGALEQRHMLRRCPACGRLTRSDGVCSCGRL